MSPAHSLPRVAPRPPRDPFTEILSLPRTLVVIDSTRFRVKDRYYRVPGLVPVAPRRICTDRDGARWACGLASRVALRTLVAGRHLACLPGPEDPGDEETAVAGGAASAEVLLLCRVDATRHLAEELLRLGAARLAEGSDGTLYGAPDDDAAAQNVKNAPDPVRLRQIEAEAQAAGAGLWRAVEEDGGRP
ncbi:hypothetical protein [Roseibium aestuarii]|uniref:Uncharacterized protein n=1 Tax=Roseibium aestuarii TaxID=2600299 RepID=A0ABW4JQP0_9HYPH|nr:hypothetical protein [Roseibium aestuarii]